VNRTQRKCLVASAAFHSLLLLLLVAGAAFLPPKPDRFELPLLDVIPATLVDAALFGGGDPKASPPVAEPPPQPAQPRPEPKVKPKPEPEPVREPAREPAPKPAPTVTTKPPPEKPVETPKPAPARPKIEVNRNVRTKPPAQEPRRTETIQNDEQRRAADQLAERLANSANRLSKSLSTETTIRIPGPGGAAFANYGQVVISIYERNWLKPEGIEQTVVVRAAVTIARDGKVISAQVTGVSGNRMVDESVERVLSRVKFVAPFPEGSTDATRLFNLNFTLKPGALTG
jgi:TonB family protein